MSHTKTQFKKQKYSTLKRRCLDKTLLFEDPEFPPSQLQKLQLPGPVVWKRPSELCSNPKLVEGRLNGSRITQGRLGNCWFVAACCALAKEKGLWNKVVPQYESQEYKSDAEDHGGIFCFRFWRFGEWVEVVIDDRLPSINGKLVFAHSKTPNEFWCSLVEKAYAKLHGSYDALKGGNMVDALIDFTAGYAERFDINEEGAKTNEDKRKEFYDHIKDEKEHHSLMCCALTGGTNYEAESHLPNGLVYGHAYCITDVRTINVKRSGLFAIFKEHEHINLIRLRNPWGKVEWNGPFSDSSPEWKTVTSKDQNKCHLNLEEDGEFWMTFDDFCQNFTELSICYMVNTSWFSFGHTWREGFIGGRWSNGPKDSSTDRSGGCSNNKTTFYRNPQYCLDVGNDGERLLVMLQQKDIWRQEHIKLPTIGMTFLKVELNRKCRLSQNSELIKACSSKFIDSRNIFHKCELAKGRYIIIPSTFDRGSCNDFILRVFSKNDINLRELTLMSPKQPRFSFQTRIHFATRVTIREGFDIKMPNSDDVCSPFFIVQCERTKAKGSTQKSTRNPKWNESVIFYRKYLNSKLKIQIWNKSSLLDVMMGQVYVEINKMDCLWSQRIKLVSADSKHRQKDVGEIVVEIFNAKDLKAI